MAYMRTFAYGDVYLLSEKCPACETESFVISGKLVCCGTKASGKPPSGWKRMSLCKSARMRLSPLVQREILSEQRNTCAYCEIPFHVPVYRHSKRWHRSIHFDHFVPWAYSFSNRRRNIVASCSVCNQIKSWLMFKDIYECQAYIMRQWRYKGFTTERPTMLVSDLRQAVP